MNRYGHARTDSPSARSTTAPVQWNRQRSLAQERENQVRLLERHFEEGRGKDPWLSTPELPMSGPARDWADRLWAEDPDEADPGPDFGDLRGDYED
ncbi:MAG: hypothetical protein IMW99_04480 [Firmicutes bacterium]|nr:hypothetical protein [Bacillota bacterium]